MPCTRTMHMLRDEQSHGLRRRANLVFWPCIAPYRPYLGTHCSTATASRQCTLSAKTAPTLPSRDCSTSGCGSTPSRRPHTHAYCICLCDDVSGDCSCLRLRTPTSCTLRPATLQPLPAPHTTPQASRGISLSLPVDPNPNPPPQRTSPKVRLLPQPQPFPTIHVCAQVPAVAFFGDWRCPLFPRLDAECLSFVGPPLQLPQLPEPTPEQVAGWDDAMYYFSMPCAQCN